MFMYLFIYAYNVAIKLEIITTKLGKGRELNYVHIYPEVLYAYVRNYT